MTSLDFPPAKFTIWSMSTNPSHCESFIPAENFEGWQSTEDHTHWWHQLQVCRSLKWYSVSIDLYRSMSQNHRNQSRRARVTELTESCLLIVDYYRKMNRWPTYRDKMYGAESRKSSHCGSSCVLFLQSHIEGYFLELIWDNNHGVLPVMEAHPSLSTQNFYYSYMTYLADDRQSSYCPRGELINLVFSHPETDRRTWAPRSIVNYMAR